MTPEVAEERPAYRLLRYEEDWRAPLAADVAPDGFDPIKRIPLGGATWLSLGGEARWRFHTFNNPDFGLVVPTDDFFLARGLVHADLHFGGTVRVFAQLGSHWMVGEAGEPGPLDEGRLDLQQGFVEVRSSAFDGGLFLRVGRQEISLGSQRLVAVRKGPNVRRSFDAARVGWRGARWRVDALAGLAVQPRIGVFDDPPDRGEALWGVYGTGPLGPGGQVDLYYLGAARAQRTFVAVAGDEVRHTVGWRWFGGRGPVDYNAEGVLQLGAIADHTVAAWTLATDTGYTWTLGEGEIRLGGRADITSGDADRDDRRLGTFDALFPKLNVFSEAALLYPSNFLDLHPMGSFRWQGLALNLSVDAYWRTALADGLYGPPGVVLAESRPDAGRFVGQEWTSELVVPYGLHTEWTLYYSHFSLGPAWAGSPAGDVDFFGTWIELTF